MCPTEKNNLGVLRDPLGHHGLWVLLSQEKKGKTFFCQGEEAKDGGPTAVWTVSFPSSKAVQSRDGGVPADTLSGFGLLLCSQADFCCVESAFLEAVQLAGEERSKGK